MDATTTEETAEVSVLQALRQLMPPRPLRMEEALRIAELQANRLLALSGINSPAVPIEIVTELPRFRAALDFDLPTSGLAHWDGTHWILTVKADEPLGRRRLSTFHEFKHVLDHPFRHLFAAERRLPADAKAERLADYFAGCVLMPRRWLKTMWTSQTQAIDELAEIFLVTPRAMAVRLSQIGLTAPARRCDVRVTSPAVSTATISSKCFRTFSTSREALV